MDAKSLQAELRRHAHANVAANLAEFFKAYEGGYGEGDQFLGLKVPVIRAVCKSFRNLPLAEIEQLLESPIHEDRLAALIVLSGQALKADPAIKRNPAFAARVRALYSATMPPPTAGTRKKTSATNTLWSELKLLKHVDGLDLNAAAPLNPLHLNEAFGPDQLPKILDALSLARLKESAAFVEERNPGTRPVSRSSKSAVMDYFIHYVN